jgi:hypothetical protein
MPRLVGACDLERPHGEDGRALPNFSRPDEYEQSGAGLLKLLERFNVLASLAHKRVAALIIGEGADAERDARIGGHCPTSDSSEGAC